MYALRTSVSNFHGLRALEKCSHDRRRKKMKDSNLANLSNQSENYTSSTI